MITFFGRDYKSSTTILRALGVKYAAPNNIQKSFGSLEAYVTKKLGMPMQLTAKEIDELHNRIETGLKDGTCYGKDNLRVIKALQSAIKAFLSSAEYKALDSNTQGRLFSLAHADDLPSELRKNLKRANS